MARTITDIYIVVLSAVRNHPGSDGIKLRDYLAKQDMKYVRELEYKGFLIYRNNAWALTSTGDLFLAENAQ